jgi:2-phosphosulfolactate phosphatase
MRLDVAFVPTLRTPSHDPASSAQHRHPARNRPLCIVVDVIRASTSLVTLVERGASRVFIAGDIDSARAAAPRTGAVLAGELEGLAPPGFTYGNSPVELSRASVDGQPVVFVTTNGTAAIRAVTDAPTVLIGALRNGAAVCREAWQEATAHGHDITIVCAGRERAFAIDDAYCAGFLIERFLESGSGDLTDAAMAAVALFRSEPDAQVVFTRSAAGRNVIRLGLAADLTYCAQRDASSVVPRLGRELFLLEAL